MKDVISDRDRGLGRDVVRARPKPKKTKASAFKAAVKYADQWFSRFIVLRDKRCVICGSTMNLQCSHVFRRHSYTTRWDSQNAYAQCKSCHFRHHNHSEYPLQKYAVTRIGQDAMDDLWLRSKKVSNFSADFIKALGDSLKKKCLEMEK